MRLSDDQRIDWLRLIRTENVGPKTFRSLINRFGSASSALDALPGLLKQTGRAQVRVTSRDDALREMERSERLGVRFIATGEQDYPVTLLAAEPAPPLIAVRGDAGALAKPMVAIVGSRNASSAGRRFTEVLARDLGDAGFVVVSGLARGIDTAAHKASLRDGTVAVLAGGHARVYPSENEPLLQDILEQGGAVVSEMPLEWEPRARDFPRRNRIVSGLSRATIVIEAARRSGSLITARFAAEQGREVFAVPGFPTDPRSEGTNDLIATGATLCRGAQDVITALEPIIRAPFLPFATMREGSDEGSISLDQPLWDELDLGDLSGSSASTTPGEASANGAGGNSGHAYSLEHPETNLDDRARVLSLLGVSPTTIDDVARHAMLPSRTVQAILLDLELEGRLTRLGGGQIALQR